MEITDKNSNAWVTSLLMHRRFSILACFLRLKINSSYGWYCQKYYEK